VDPADVRRCEVCHDPKSGAAQATAYLTKPTRVACGACHDDVNFATGANHAGGPQISDNQCATCHIPVGELDFDAGADGVDVLAVLTQGLHRVAPRPDAQESEFGPYARLRPQSVAIAHVPLRSAEQYVPTTAADQKIAARLTLDMIAARPAVQAVAPRSTGDRVVAGEAEHVVP